MLSEKSTDKHILKHRGCDGLKCSKCFYNKVETDIRLGLVTCILRINVDDSFILNTQQVCDIVYSKVKLKYINKLLEGTAT
jgi:hypothetical protein